MLFKKLLGTALAAILVVSSSTFAQYGGGGSTYYPSPILTKDECPYGDYSASYHDSTCGTAIFSGDVLISWPSQGTIVKKLIKKYKKKRLSINRYLQNNILLNMVRTIN
jgi:hypothetical protein